MKKQIKKSLSCILFLLLSLTICACGLRSDTPGSAFDVEEGVPVPVAEYRYMGIPIQFKYFDNYAFNHQWFYVTSPKVNWDTPASAEDNNSQWRILRSGIGKEFQSDIYIVKDNAAPLALLTDCESNCYVFWQHAKEAAYFLEKYDEEGNCLFSVEYPAEELMNKGSMLTEGAVDREGRIYLWYGGNGGSIYDFGEDGVLREVYTPELKALEGIAVGKENRLYGYCISNGEPEVAEVTHPENRYSCPFIPLKVYGGYEDGLYLTDSDGLWRYEPETGEAELMWNWLDEYVQIDAAELEDIFRDDSGVQLLCPANTADNEITFWPYDLTFVTVTWQDSREYPGKQVITLGGATITEAYSHVEELVWEYNRQSRDYKVELYPTKESSRSEAFSALEMELLRGEGPDIVELSSAYGANLASKGALEDLTAYYKKDSEISQNDLLEPVKEAGCLMNRNVLVISSFHIGAFISKTEINQEEWTPWAFLELARSNQLFQYPSRMGALSYCMGSRYAERFVDYEKRECYFDSQEFISILEACGSLEQVEVPMIEYVGDYLEKDYLLLNSGFNGLWDYLSILGAYERKVFWSGYPGWEGAECGLIPNEIFAINSASENKEGAWDFLSFVLSEEMQDRIDWGFPARKDSFEKMLESYEDEVRVEDFGWTLGKGTTLLEGDLDMVRQLVESAVYDTAGAGNVIRSIIFEEAGMYFAGDATLEDTVRKIQNRVSLYLEEL